MTKQQINALLASWRHWDRMAQRKRRRMKDAFRDRIYLEEPCTWHCGCCLIWINDDCEGYPIAESTGDGGCHGTPYVRAANAFDVHGPDSDEFAAAARVEADFILSLIPEDHRP